MGTLNVANRTLAVMDNLQFLRAINNECVDLIAIDPPFAKNETFTKQPRPPITPAELDEERELAASHGVEHSEGIGETRVQDVWRWDADVHPAWQASIADDHPAVHAVIEAVEACAHENEAAYIAYMAIRLLECRRVLRPTGSIYVHCDDQANAYLRMLLNAIFGADHFRNEIVWRRATSHNDASRYGRILDTILFYGKTDAHTWNGNAITEAKSDAELQDAYPAQDERGHYRSADLTGPQHNAQSGAPSTLPWQGYDVFAMGRVWSVPKTGKYAEYIEREFIPGYRAIDGLHARLDALDEAGLIYHPEQGRWPGLKRYAAADTGKSPQNLVLQPTGFTNFSTRGGEYTNYATQKPLALYERIVKASSNPGDVVMDIFAGCATTAVAAERLGRQWIACDMAYRSWTMLKRRFYLNGIRLTGMTDATIDAMGDLVKKRKGFQLPQQWTSGYVIGPNELPEREVVDPDVAIDPLGLGQRRSRSIQNANWSGRITKDEAKQLLVDKFGPVCWGCGYEPRRPNGSLDLTLLEVDHIRARRPTAGAPGDDELYNLALLHRTCNGVKGNRMTLEDLRRHNGENGWLYVDKATDLVDLAVALQFAMDQIMQRGIQFALENSSP